MSNYDFKALNDKEFEAFCADLLSAHVGTRFERFKPGKDLGVDGRFFTESGTEVVLQCKHWANTAVSQLITEIKKEKPKLDKLKPAKYILAVSNNLSRLNKMSIATALAPHILSESDIYGNEDLNDILSSHKGVERNHYKLWLSSTEVVTNLLNNAIVGRSRDELELIEERFQNYVKTSNHDAAIEQLERLHVIIITGEPGIGKTTLAGQICLDYAAQGYSFVKIGEDIAEAEALFDSDSKQIYFFDDFLGRNYLDALNGHEGGQITSFIRRISKNKNKRFVLTSRSTILNQGKLLIDLLQHSNTTRNEFEMNIRRLSDLDKAKILYNHIWFSNLSLEYIDVIYEKARYLDIVKHPNFNPRLISYVTDFNRLEDISSEQYWTYIGKSLANPAQIWGNPFDAQQDDFTRSLVLLVVLNGKRISESRLSESYYEYVALPENQSMQGRRDFHSNIESLTGSFLNRYISSGSEPQFDLFNPSIGDYVLRRYTKNKTILKAAFSCLHSLDALRSFESLYEDKQIREADAQEVVLAMLKRAKTNEYGDVSIGYLLELFAFIMKKWTSNAKLTLLLRDVCVHVWRNASEMPPTQNLLILLNWGANQSEILHSEIRDFLTENFEYMADDSQISQCWKLMQNLLLKDDVRNELYRAFGVSLAETIGENLNEFIETTDAYGSCEYGEYREARSRLAELVGEKLNSLGIPDGIVDGAEAVDGYDVQDDMDSYFRNSYEPSYQSRTQHSGGGESADGAIHDLFDRD